MAVAVADAADPIDVAGLGAVEHVVDGGGNRLGGNPEDDGTLLAAAHRQFLNLRALFDSDVRTAVNEVERGEDVIKAKYEAALKLDLSADVRASVQRAYESVRAGHDTFSAMKKRYAA